MYILGVIPARGGSKGIPGKNIRPLAGKPLIAWTIEAAQTSRLLTRTIVSTDSEEIAAVARGCGGDVPFLRPKEISGDLATDVEFLTHAWKWLKETEDIEADIIVRLPPTSPLRTAEHIDTGIEFLLSDPDADSVRPITKALKHPYKMWLKDGEYLKPFLSKQITGLDEPWNLPRQMFPEVYVHTGAMDVIRRKTLLVLRSTSGTRIRYVEMSPEDSVNIDYPIDFSLAEILFQNRLH